MQTEFTFKPNQRLGRLFHIGVIAVITIAGITGLFLASQANIGPVFILYLSPTLFAFLTLPIFSYRLYALLNGVYRLERDRVLLRWGLRIEEIPMDDVLWIYPKSDLSVKLPYPTLRWPGSVLGHRRLSPNAGFTGVNKIEYLAGSVRDLVFIATPKRLYAISPAEPTSFLNAYQRLIEMGSITPFPARTIYPTFLLRRLWADQVARILLIIGFTISLVLIIWVSLLIPTRSVVYFGFQPSGFYKDAVPTVRLLLLPVINITIFLADFLLGLFFFRRAESIPYAYILWGGGVMTPILFIVGVYFILQSV